MTQAYPESLLRLPPLGASPEDLPQTQAYSDSCPLVFPLEPSHASAGAKRLRRTAPEEKRVLIERAAREDTPPQDLADDVPQTQAYSDSCTLVFPLEPRSSSASTGESAGARPLRRTAPEEKRVPIERAAPEGAPPQDLAADADDVPLTQAYSDSCPLLFPPPSTGSAGASGTSTRRAAAEEPWRLPGAPARDAALDDFPQTQVYSDSCQLLFPPGAGGAGASAEHLQQAHPEDRKRVLGEDAAQASAEDALPAWPRGPGAGAKRLRRTAPEEKRVLIERGALEDHRGTWRTTSRRRRPTPTPARCSSRRGRAGRAPARRRAPRARRSSMRVRGEGPWAPFGPRPSPCEA
ncbi:unnamed protein product [Prorocentrum cordatum]|uniref:Uncharacterized protein n=1 Tax=Prorocentrum cordatum TaxID=2364126 RepID=A0ABN9SBT8_9DINO|nr:unnamed protein product [Polarella glacialis]